MGGEGFASLAWDGCEIPRRCKYLCGIEKSSRFAVTMSVRHPIRVQTLVSERGNENAY